MCSYSAGQRILIIDIDVLAAGRFNPLFPGILAVYTYSRSKRLFVGLFYFAGIVVVEGFRKPYGDKALGIVSSWFFFLGETWTLYRRVFSFLI